jgi:fructokinase
MILVCGEALIDLFVTSDGNDRLKTNAVLGGSPFNVAVALSRLGERSSFLGGLSTDTFGRALAQKLVSEGVDLSYAVRSESLTTISVVATDEHGQPTYSFHGEGKADREVTSAQLPSALPDSIKAMTFGSYTMTVKPVGDAFLSLAEREAGRLTISIDPNLRQTVTPNMGEWRSRFEAYLPYADIIKTSDEDLATAYGSLSDLDGLVARWQAAGPALIIVTYGDRGAAAYLRGHKPIFVPARRVAVIDTVGAGDTFHAAALAYLAKIDRLAKPRFQDLSEPELQEALEYAVAAASITCTRQGADLPTHFETEAVLMRCPPP